MLRTRLEELEKQLANKDKDKQNNLVKSWTKNDVPEEEGKYIYCLVEGGAEVPVDISSLKNQRIKKIVKNFGITDQGNVFHCSIVQNKAVWTQYEIPTSLQSFKISYFDKTENMLVALTDSRVLWVWDKKQNCTNVTSQIKQKVAQVSCGQRSFQVLTENGEIFEIICEGNRLVYHQRVCPYQITQIASGDYHHLLLADNGTILSYGNGAEGRLGHGDIENQKEPQVIKYFVGQRIVAVACGAFHSACLTNKGELFTWGAGKYGCLGHGKQNNELLPKRVDAFIELQGTKRIVSIACELLHTAAITVDGSVFTFGFRMTPPQDKSRYSNEVATIPRLALNGKHIVNISCSTVAPFLIALKGEIKGATSQHPITLNP